MNNKEKYRKAFMDCFEVSEGECGDLTYTGIQAWDSVGHMTLISALEDTFDIMMDTDDIIDLNSYKKGMEILSEKYDVEF